MKTKRFLHIFTILSLCSGNIANAGDNRTEKVPRKNGEFHKAFVQLLQKEIKNLPSGTGRISLQGVAGFLECSADMYISNETTFVSLNVDGLGYIDEFYIDHPSESFKTVLFQNRTVSNNEISLSLDRRNSGFEIKRSGDNLIIKSRKQKTASPYCHFDLRQATYFDGESE